MDIQENFYLSRYQFRSQSIFSKPNNDLGLIIVIPCYKEKFLLNSLEALYSCDLPKCSVEVIVVINCSKIANPEIQKQTLLCYQEAITWTETHNQNSKLEFHILLENEMPKKDAGVGLARKIGMDEAVRRLEWINNHEAVISCFDADSLCEKNYLCALVEHFQKNKKTTACALHFEHPLEGNEDQWIYEGIINYELHLRYYVNILRFAHYPDAYQTIGSSMAVRSNIYQKQGGMNKRKAGEDFYFLHKIIPLGNFSELKTTKVIPSPRISDRVPFGTGKAIGDFMEQEDRNIYYTYNIQSFLDLKQFLEKVEDLYTYTNEELKSLLISLPESIKNYLTELNIEKHLPKIQKQSNTLSTFENRFFIWFNGLVILKYVHFARDHFYPNENISDAIQKLVHILELPEQENNKVYLEMLRRFDINN